MEYRITDADGNTRWVEDYGHYVRSEAAGDIFYVFISDATEKMLRKLKKEVSQEIEQKKLLEQALKNANLAFVAKNAFLSNMSHDLRTPLNAIFGFATLAEKNINNPQVAAGYLDKIREAGNNILELIERVLELSYMETQDFRITEAPCDLREIAYGVYTSLLTQAKTKQIKFRFILLQNQLSAKTFVKPLDAAAPCTVKAQARNHFYNNLILHRKKAVIRNRYSTDG